MNGPANAKALGCGGQCDSRWLPQASTGIRSTGTGFAVPQALCLMPNIVQGLGWAWGWWKRPGRFKEADDHGHWRGRDGQASWNNNTLPHQ